MNTLNCPYLGLKEDPTTALDFPSQGNFCHHARPVAPVKGTYQQQYCLTAEHTACPIFQAAQPIPLPPALIATDSSPVLSRRMMVILGIPVLLAGTALVMGWNAISSRSVQSNAIADTGGGALIPSAWALLSTQPENTPFTLPTATTTAQSTVANCPLPAGWIPYTVNPTDSLYRLSVIYGVSVEQLQQVNCMGDKTTILPGQVIYVPSTPTDTPTPTATPVPVLAVNGSVGSNNNQPAAPVPTATPVPTGHSPIPPPTAVPTSQPTNPPPKIKPTNPPPGHPKVDPTPKPKSGGKDHNGGKGHGKGKGKGRG